MSRIRHLAYLVFFLSILLLTTAATLVLRLLAVDRLARAWRRVRKGPPRVFFLACFFPGNAGFEHRVRRWATILEGRGQRVSVRYVYDGPTFALLMARRNLIAFQVWFLITRLWHCLQAVAADVVVVERELLLYNDYGGTFLERFLLALNRNVALDYDDDLTAAKREGRRSLFARLMFASDRKFTDALVLYPNAIAGSNYLAGLIPLESGPKNVVVVPTCVDLARYRQRRYASPTGGEPITFGWIGTVGNLKLLDIVIPALESLAAEVPCRLLVISGRSLPASGKLEIVNRPWSLETEVDDLLSIDIGLMPLLDDDEARGKCGFKLLQYMACGIVGMASAVTVNTEIVTDGANGFLVQRPEDWPEALGRVLDKRARFSEIGEKARQRAADYTFEAHTATLVDFLGRIGHR